MPPEVRGWGLGAKWNMGTMSDLDEGCCGLGFRAGPVLVTGGYVCANAESQLLCAAPRARSQEGFSTGDRRSTAMGLLATIRCVSEKQS